MPIKNTDELICIFETMDNEEKARDLVLDWVDQFLDDQELGLIEQYVDYAQGHIQTKTYRGLAYFMADESLNATKFNSWIESVKDSSYFVGEKQHG